MSNLIYDSNLYKRCSKKLECIHPQNIDGWLLKSEFKKRKNRKNGVISFCNYCNINYKRNYYKNNKKHIVELATKRYINKQKNDLWYILSKRKNDSNKISKNRIYKKEFTLTGNGKHNNLYDVLSRRKTKSNSKTKQKGKIEMLTTLECVAKLISQNYKCPITEDDLSEQYGYLSLEHIIPNEQGGLNIIDNIIFCHVVYNYGKNGHDMKFTLDTFLKVAFPGEINKEKRQLRIDIIMNKIWDINQIYPQIYNKLKNKKNKELKEILEKRLTINDILKLT